MTPERLDKLTRVAMNRRFDITVILENVHDPHNISAVLRSCDAVGIAEVYVIDDVIKYSKRNGKRSSSSANKWVDVKLYKTIDECLTEVRKKYNKLLCTHLNAEAIGLYENNFSEGSIALVFGNEHDGVSTELLSKCDGNIFIPQIGMISSLNISVACAVTLYEVFRQRINLNENYMQPQKQQLLDSWLTNHELI
jgi:tRNA (guanosine-2'-O-)-methyltransferase